MIITVASGKGGTGKTSVAVNMALSIGSCQVLDCDVEEPNAHLLLHPKTNKTEPVYASNVKIDKTRCRQCGVCAKFCRYNALFCSFKGVLVFPELCHGCGGCITVCPEKAISEESYKVGTLNFCQAGDIDLVYGELEVGKPMAGPVIKAVKKQAAKDRPVIVDSPPGASCSFVETVRNTDYCVLVTEPTPFGLHDLKITVEVLKKMGVPFGVVVNRSGIGDKTVYGFTKQENIPVLLEIPYDRKIAELYSKGVAFSMEMPQWTTSFQNLFNQIRRLTSK
ncbi:MAG: ATP-binding protein [Candidatus Bathyarchaeia archaeon]|jgi:MinD superfamily P-loop ATPase